MAHYYGFKTEIGVILANLLAGSSKLINDNGDIVWRNNDVVLTTLTAKKLADVDHYDELDGFRIYDAAIVEHEEWFKHTTAAEQRADKADYDLDNARNR